MGILKWASDRLHKRVDELGKEKASTEAVHQLREDFFDYRDETREAMRELNTNVLTVLGRLK